MSNRDALDLEAFETLLETFGPEFRRWPDTNRAAAEALLAVDLAARRLLGEAQALDRLMDRAPHVAPERYAPLADRILLSVAGRAMPARGSETAAVATVVPFARRAAAPAVQVPLSAKPMPKRRPPWAAAVALAASLAAGMVIGSLDLAVGPARGIAAIAGLESDVEHVVASLHSDGLTAALEEDQL